MGAILYWFGVLSLDMHAVNNGGHMITGWDFQMDLYTCAVLAVTMRIAMITNYWTWVNHLFYWGGIFVWFLWCFVQGAVPTGILTHGYLYMIIYPEFQMAIYWLSIILLPFIITFPALVVMSISTICFPSLSDKVRDPRYWSELMKNGLAHDLPVPGVALLQFPPEQPPSGAAFTATDPIPTSGASSYTSINPVTPRTTEATVTTPSPAVRDINSSSSRFSYRGSQAAVQHAQAAGTCSMDTHEPSPTRIIYGEDSMVDSKVMRKAVTVVRAASALNRLGKKSKAGSDSSPRRVSDRVAALDKNRTMNSQGTAGTVSI